VVALVLVVALGEFGRLSDYKEIKGVLMEQLEKTKFGVFLKHSNT